MPKKRTWSELSRELKEHLGASVRLPVQAEDADEVWLERVTSDSRQASQGSVFVAIKGVQTDGHDYLLSAWRAGASAFVMAEGALVPDELAGLPVLSADDPRVVLALLAALLHEPLSETLRAGLVGITGTNGKTSTTYMLESILRVGECVPGVIGTVNYRLQEHIWPAALTTPPPELLWSTLERMQARGATHVMMEVSSHALDQHRVDNIPFAVAGFTNLTQDHLDYHQTFDAYKEAKGLLFSRCLEESGRAVLNGDDPASAYMAQVSRAPVWHYSTQPDADAALRVIQKDIGLHGIHVSVEVRTELGAPFVLEIESPLLGAFHLHNLLLACGIAHALGVAPETIVQGLKELDNIPGRLERVRLNQEDTPDITVLVDYAHTPDALEQALATIRELCDHRVIGVFGCGGDRDKGKRPLMGEAVARAADICIVTSDNPRNEEPQSIIDEIVVGVSPHQEALGAEEIAEAQKGYWVCPDRAVAIHQAIASAAAGDVVLIAGKGHETYQIIKGTRYPFSDREVAQDALRKRLQTKSALEALHVEEGID